MGIKKYKPTSPGIRFQTGLTFDEITTREPLKALVQGTSKTGGRNNNGRITVRHRGGGHKRRFRVVDFKRDKNDVPGKVVNVEYDPNRSAHLALINYAMGTSVTLSGPRA
jgi:large subunit ribosomal protein L2